MSSCGISSLSSLLWNLEHRGQGNTGGQWQKVAKPPRAAFASLKITNLKLGFNF
jgi:hypothetical protein